LKLDRRTLLIGGGAGVGLIVAYSLWPRGGHTDIARGMPESTFGHYVKVARDGQVTVTVPQAETGQGAWTALPQIVADELGAAWETVAVEPAPIDKAYANPLAGTEGWPKGAQITAAATSVRAFERPLREAAAVARAMLVGAAADRWNVSPGDCEAADGFVINGARTFTFGELAEEAAGRTPPLRPQLRPTAKSRLIGQPLARLDGPAKANGSLRFAADVRLPNMLFAAVRIAPPGGRLQGYRREPVATIPGVRHVTARDTWVAIVADSWWTAEHALQAADPVFSGTRGPADLRARFDAALNGDAETLFTRGDYDGVTRGSRPLAATYYVAPSQHLGLEPVSATARASGGSLEVWTGSQAPSFIHDARLYPLPVGEPAGRALEADAVPYAVELARALKRPVQVTLSQAQGQNHDRVAPGALARMTALPGEGGFTAAWAMRVATADGMSAALARLAGEKPPAKLGKQNFAGAVPPYAIPNVRIEGVHIELPFAAGYMRGSPERELAFFTESFIDELAHAAGLEPLSLRMALLGQNGRLARCLQAATRRAQWDGGGRGSTMGIAGASAFGSHIGLVASASIGPDQRVKVDRLVAAVDCGRVISSSLAEQQIQSGLIWALAQATVPSPEWVAGMPRARPLGGIGLPRIGDVSEIVVEIIPSGTAPGGLNGLSTIVLAPAVANAIYAGTGKRLRTLPFDPMATA
jgi:isoquinoline 1-oxidoreductase beta subunit